MAAGVALFASLAAAGFPARLFSSEDRVVAQGREQARLIITLANICISQSRTEGADTADVADFVLEASGRGMCGAQPALVARAGCELDRRTGGSFLNDTVRQGALQGLLDAEILAYAPEPGLADTAVHEIGGVRMSHDPRTVLNTHSQPRHKPVRD